MEVRIRMAEERDEIAVLGSELALLRNLNGRYLEPEALKANLEASCERFNEIISGFSCRRILVAEVCKGAAGYCLFDMASSERVTFVDQLYVNPNFRGMSIGRRILEEIIKLSELKGISDVHVICPFNDIAENFYKKLGFKPTNRYGGKGLQLQIH